MDILRLIEKSVLVNGTYEFDVELELADGQKKLANTPFQFQLSHQEEQDLKWYWEDYLDSPETAVEERVKRIERSIEDIGKRLFENVFVGEAWQLYSEISGNLGDVRIEVITGLESGVNIPWELLVDPKSQLTLALSCKFFVRGTSLDARPKQHSINSGTPINILLVISRPDADKDVAYRSVASQILRGLSRSHTEIYLEVLRPPTFQNLSSRLRQARMDGFIFHIVHFDGHGVYKNAGSYVPVLDSVDAPRGYFVFESKDEHPQGQLIDGATLGRVLTESQVSMVVLNACRSAYADAQAPQKEAEECDAAHNRQFGSLAQELITSGMKAVVAMRYIAWTRTVAQFVFDLYETLAQGHDLGSASAYARKQLHANSIGSADEMNDAVKFIDWPIPIVYEAAELKIFQKQAKKPIERLLLEPESGLSEIELCKQLPPLPDIGFIGRDETILRLDRVFDDENVALLHGIGGAGKTATACEFARWMLRTGGFELPVLFTSFERYCSLSTVLDQAGWVFWRQLGLSAVAEWTNLDLESRKKKLLRLFASEPVFWIWDNTESIGGFPDGAASQWKASEQEDIHNFLQSVRGTKAKILLTSRRTETRWLGDLPARVEIPPMPRSERWKLGKGIARKYGAELHDLKVWKSLLDFTQGNPLTITVVFRQAALLKLFLQEDVDKFTAELASGEAKFDDDQEQGRSRSLSASLAYGFEKILSAEERQVLAVLHLFQGNIMTGTLTAMAEAGLTTLSNLSLETEQGLLQRGSEIGLLSPLGPVHFQIHPGVPSYLSSVYNTLYVDALDDEGDTLDMLAEKAFVAAMARTRRSLLSGSIVDISTDRPLLMLDENNLLRARELALDNGWYAELACIMDSLSVLYEHGAYRSDWSELLEEVIPHFLNPEGDPVAGREWGWRQIMELRVEESFRRMDWKSTESLLRKIVTWDKHELEKHPCTLLPFEVPIAEVRDIMLAGSLAKLGQIQANLGEQSAFQTLQEAFDFAVKQNNNSAAATAAAGLGRAYFSDTSPKSLDKAEEWLRRSIELMDPDNHHDLSLSWWVLGSIGTKRFGRAVQSKATSEIQKPLFKEALDCFKMAATIVPQDYDDTIGKIYDGMGELFLFAKLWDKALESFDEAIKHFSRSVNVYLRGHSREQAGFVLFLTDRDSDAVAYLKLAIADFEASGDQAASSLERAKKLLVKILAYKPDK